MKRPDFHLGMRSAAFAAAAVCAALAMQNVFAQQQTGPQGPPRIDFALELGISPQKAAEVEAILKEGREQARAAHERAHAKLAQTLTGEQLSRLEQLMPRPPMGPGRNAVGPTKGQGPRQ
jgi:hypothetical protein